MSPTIAIAPVHKSVIVKASPQRAFEVFTLHVDRWWPKAKGIGETPIRQSTIEPFVGGRWYTIFEDGREAVVGHVRVWDPGKEFVVSWEINSKWKPDTRVELASEVSVRFLAEVGGGTRVELEHRNFERMGAAEGEAMRGGVDGGWPGMLGLFAREADRT
jgi:uncharacterized protein YndB with AHSA1/START domain